MYWKEYINHGDGQAGASSPTTIRIRMGVERAALESTHLLVCEAVWVTCAHEAA